MIKLNKENFQKLIDDDIAYLKVVLKSDTAQKAHIIQILKQAPDRYYQPPNQAKFCPKCARNTPSCLI